MLGVAVGAQAAISVFVMAPALLIPTWHLHAHLSLERASWLATMPNLGMMIALIAWGALADRFGERIVMSVGLVTTSVIALLTVFVHGYIGLGVLFFCGGVSSASVNAASGRVVVGWFPTPRRGTAMGIRQIAQPVGVFVAALFIPALAEQHSVRVALIVPFVATVFAAVTCLVVLVDPVRSTLSVEESRNPYRENSFLQRIHATSALLVVPQFTLSVFGLVWFKVDLHWSITSAALLIGVSQLIGSAGRIGVGALSDRVSSRLRPLRWVASSAVVVMIALGLVDHVNSALSAGLFVLATAISVADNGLGFTAVAERAGPAWAGRALGAQNTGQFAVAAIVGPTMGLLISTVGYPATFCVAGGCAAVAVVMIPRGHGELRE